jgi:hypothetical protein
MSSNNTKEFTEYFVNIYGYQPIRGGYETSIAEHAWRAAQQQSASRIAELEAEVARLRVDAVPVAWSLQWPFDRESGTINYMTTFKSEDAARSYVDQCLEGLYISVVPLYREPPAPAIHPGTELAAKHIERRAAEYDDSYGYTEPDTNARVYPSGGEDYCNNLLDLADEVRELVVPEQAAPAIPGSYYALHELDAEVGRLKHDVGRMHDAMSAELSSRPPAPAVPESPALQWLVSEADAGEVFDGIDNSGRAYQSNSLQNAIGALRDLLSAAPAQENNNEN